MITTPPLFASHTRFFVGLGGVVSLLAFGIACLFALSLSHVTIAGFMGLMKDPYFQHVIFITTKQALLSVAFATVIGVTGALAFHRRRFYGRGWLLMGCFSAMIMPTTVAAIALLKLWGQSGLLAGLLADTVFGTLLPDRLGLWSVILAHSFFNAPLVMRVCLSALDGVSRPQRRQAALLKLSAYHYFTILDMPAIKVVLPSIMGLVFLLCFTSFSLVLMLGGGPAITTLEVSIYTALRFDFDLPKAALLSVIQLLICTVILRLFARQSSQGNRIEDITHSQIIRADSSVLVIRCLDALFIFTIILLNIVPLILLIAQSDFLAGTSLLWTARFWLAFANSLSLAVGSAALALGLSLILGFFTHELFVRRAKFLPYLVELSHSVYLLIPALVLGTSLFILLRSFGNVSDYTFGILLVGNAMLALPFSYRIITPALRRQLSMSDPVCAMLGVTGLKRHIRITFPAITKEIGFALGLSAALSFGDLGIITIFGSQTFETLPYMLFQFLNRYGANEADLLALILLASAIFLYFLFSKCTSWIGHILARM